MKDFRAFTTLKVAQGEAKRVGKKKADKAATPAAAAGGADD